MAFKYLNLDVIGTSHIAKESYKAVESFIIKHNPDIIALELDRRRFVSLLSEKQAKMSFGMVRQLGIKGFLLTLVGSYIQRKLGSKVGVLPGEEMRTAIKLARKLDLQIALIDQDISITLRNLTSSITWKERFNFIGDFFRGLFFKKKQMKDYGLESLDLSKVPSSATINKVIKALKKRYPNIYRSLISDRNKFMSKNLVNLMLKFPEKKILAIVGAGHEDALIDLVKTKYIKTSTT